MNNPAFNKVGNLIKDSFQYWDDLLNEFGISKDDGLTQLTIYSAHDIIGDPEIEELYKGEVYCHVHGIMNTTIYCLGDAVDIEDKNDVIVTGTLSKVYMCYQELFELIIDCNMDFDKALESMKYMLRHEFGHVLVYKKRFIGKEYGYYLSCLEKLKADYVSMPKLRKNASLKSRLAYDLKYMHLPDEAAANEEVGITDEDIIANFNRRNGGII